MASLSTTAPLPAEPLPAQRAQGYWAAAGVRFVHDPVAVGALIAVLLLFSLALFGPWIAPADPYQASMLNRLKPIGTEGMPLGSDELGRDMLAPDRGRAALAVHRHHAGGLCLRAGHQHRAAGRVMPVAW